MNTIEKAVTDKKEKLDIILPKVKLLQENSLKQKKSFNPTSFNNAFNQFNDGWNNYGR